MFVPAAINDLEKTKEERVIHTKCFYRIDRFLFFIKQRKIFNALKYNITSIKPDVFHAHFVFSSGYICMKFKEKYDIPYIVSVQNTDVNLFFRYMIHMRKVGMNIMLNTSKIIFISSSYRDEVINKYIPVKKRKSILEKSVIIPFGIDEFWLTKSKIKYKKIEVRKIKLLTVATINRNKNQLTVAKVAELLNNKGYQITYTVIGKIGDKNIYRKLVKYNFVRYIENLPKEKLIEYYKNADIFIMPSIHETFGLVYAEALTQGLPIIYTKDQGFAGNFKDGEVGYAVPRYNTKYIYDCILKITENYKNISDRCIKNSLKFDWNKIAEKFSQIYISVEKKKW